jgi:hypothetical protein
VAPETARLYEKPGYESSIHRMQSYLARGRYAEQLERWLQFFPREQMRIYSMDELARDPEGLHSDLFDFLGLKQWRVPDLPRQNTGSYDAMDPEMRSRLEDYFAPHNRRLYELLGRDLGWSGSSSRFSEAPTVEARRPWR